jgi:hypothetical protein
VLPNIEVEAGASTFRDHVFSVDAKLLDCPCPRSIDLPRPGEIADESIVAFMVMIMVET